MVEQADGDGVPRPLVEFECPRHPAGEEGLRGAQIEYAVRVQEGVGQVCPQGERQAQEDAEREYVVSEETGAH